MLKSFLSKLIFTTLNSSENKIIIVFGKSKIKSIKMYVKTYVYYNHRRRTKIMMLNSVCFNFLIKNEKNEYFNLMDV